ncbi:MAG: DUF2267 domain-containing protein [Cyanobacteria bacterium J06621_8]
MTITLRDDIMYILLDKIDRHNEVDNNSVDFQATDFTGKKLTIADFLGHLDYLNQKKYINAEFSGNAYANQEDVPDLVNPEEVDFRIANTLGAEDAPFPHLIKFKGAELTEKGEQMLARMKDNPPKSLKKGASVPIVARDTDFLEKVALRGGLPDIFDARDLTTIVYRTMRDLMTNKAVRSVESELQSEASSSYRADLQEDIADLWRESNPLVAWISSIRPTLEFDADTFILRIETEGGLPSGTSGEKVIKSVFAATKEELPEEKAQEIAEFLPGKIKDMWQSA